MAEEWKEKGILCGYYDFGMTNHITPGKSAESAVSGNVPGIGPVPDAVCEAWAAQLGAAYPELSSSIIRALSEIHRSSPSSPTRGFADQIKALILKPLKALHRARQEHQPPVRVLFILDSIDECPPFHRAAILYAIKAVHPAFGARFFLISKLPTTEAESDIAAELLEAPPGLITRGSININSASNMADILLYLTAQFQVHAEQFNNHPQFRSALIEPTIRVLAKRADGVILWAKMAFEMLLIAENPTRMLLNLVEEDSLTDLNGLYLELLLMTQKNLDALNEERPLEGGDLEPFPKNALAMVLSAIGYSMEGLSVATIAELTGLGLERTFTILDLLSIVLDRTDESVAARLLSSPSRTRLGPPPKSNRRSSSVPRKSFTSSRQRTSSRPGSAGGATHNPPTSPLSGTFPSSRQKTVNRPSSAGGATHHTPTSPLSSGFPSSRQKMSNRPSSAGGVLSRPPQSPLGGLFPGRGSIDTRRSRHDAGPSISGALLAPPGGSSSNLDLGEDDSGIAVATAKSPAVAIVRIRHTTFLQWIRLPHPPTLLSCLTGKGAAEEDDLRFLIAPSREGGHAMLAKGCFAVIRGTALSPEQVAARTSEQPYGEGDIVVDAQQAQQVATVYSCRYWSYHCAEMLSSLTEEYQRSAIYMSVASSGGTRWKGIRRDMLEFFSRKLLWWIDASIALGSAALVGEGLQALQEVLKVWSYTAVLNPS